MNILEVKDLRKRFGDNEVLKGINLSLKKGEVLSIIGSSGGGKTTLLRCLNFLEIANSGEISVADRDTAILDPFPQNLHVIPRQTVKQKAVEAFFEL